MDFRQPYNRATYLSFLRSKFLPEDFVDSDEKVSFSFQPQFIRNVVKLGEVPSLDLCVYEAEHPSENDPRVSLSRDAFRLMAQYGKKYALIFLVSENSSNFRLSLVTIDLKWEEGKRIQKEYSTPRRYSFFLGPETKIHTPEEYLVKQGRIKDFEDLKKRFSIEVVNKEFYTQITMLFTQLAGGKREVGRKSIDAGDGCLKLPSTNDDVLRKEFTVRLIGRLVFCWFLKKKKSDKGITLLSEDLLSTQAVSQNKDYYHRILEPLFFEVLNTPVERRDKEHKSAPWDQTPFLNGGLFNPHHHDFYDPGVLGISKHINTLRIPDNWFKELFEIFETYNFTIDENTSVDVELSIEPEMLGRIFENLLAEINPETGETARKATGSYYTPRPIVEYMVDESLKQYLLTKTGFTQEKISALLTYDDLDTGLSAKERESVIEALDTIKIIDPACGSGAFPMGVLQKMLLILQKVDPDSQNWLDKKLAVMEDAALRKDLKTKLRADNFNYIHKLGIIRDAIYGVDIQPIAVEISKLRFFLSLIVDEKVNDTKENRGIEPLPNLEFKFVCAHSLIGLPKVITKMKKGITDKQQTMLEATTDIDLLKNLRDEYLRSFGEEKKKIEKKFQEVQGRMFKHSLNWGGQDSQTLKLSMWNPFSEEPCSWFDPDWMFGIKDGFDIVIANPPYVGEKGHKEIFKRVKQGILSKFYLGKMDYFYFFFHLSLNIAKNNSSIAFITTNYYPTAMGAYKLRQDFKERAIIKNLMNFNELKIFESALGQHNMITILEKVQDESAIAQTCITQRQGIADLEALQQILNGSDTETQYYKVNQKDIYDGNEYYVRLGGQESYENNNPLQIILAKIKNQGQCLGVLCNVNNGVFAGADRLNKDKKNKYKINDAQVDEGIFVLTNDEVENFRLSKNEKALIKPLFKNSDIKKYYTNTKNELNLLNLRYTDRPNLDDYPNIKSHLVRFKKLLADRPRTGTLESALNSGYWYVMSTSRKLNFDAPKIVFPQRSNINTFGYNEIPWYAMSDVFFITSKEEHEELNLKYILALLNSKLYFVWLYFRGKRKGEVLELTGNPVSEIPIKKINLHDQRLFIEIVDKILSVTNPSDYLTNSSKQAEVKKYEHQIDQMVYDLYGLTKKEIAIVEQFGVK